MTRLRSSLSAFALACAATLPAQAQMLPPPQNVVALVASASVDVPQDLLAVVFTTTRQGPEAAAVQSQLKQALDAALAEARRAAKPGALEVKTGNFALYPRYAPQGGAISGWQGSAELVIEGRDAQAVAQLAGRIQTMTVARTSFLLSREAREKAEAQMQAEAIARFRARADEAAKLFGFAGWTLREANVGGGEAPPMPMPVAAMRSATAQEALPVEAGRTTVSATVGGSVQLYK